MTALTHHESPAAPAPARTHTGRVLLVTCLVVVVARCAYLWQPLRSDEGGYLLAARQWHSGGEFLYGDYYVDRPPGLMLLFRLAAVGENDRAIRALAIPFALLLVLASARAAFLAAGPRAVPWAATAAAAFAVTPALAADQADGELFAAPLVAATFALALDAWRRQRGSARAWLAVGAGVLAAAATLVKQNFVEGFVLVLVLVTAEGVRQRRVTPRGRVLLLGLLVGGALPNLAVLAWASRTGVGELEVWTELAAFRGRAFTTIWSGHVESPLRRATGLAGLAVVSGMVGLAWAWFTRRGPTTPVTRAVGATLAVGLLGLVAGGSYWPHYLLALAPGLALAAGIVAVGPDRRARPMRWWTVAAAGSALVAVAGSVLVYATVPPVWWQERTGQWLRTASRPGDSAVVTYGDPSILEAADLPSPYPYLWSLPMRVLDPDQARLRTTLAGPEAPTWVVVTAPLNSWDVDAHGRLRTMVEHRYDHVATVCGNPVWLRTDRDRTVPPTPEC